MARLSKKKVSEAIKIYRGNLSRVADACGVTRGHIYNFINGKAPELWDEIKEARETIVDDLEQKGFDVAMRGHAGMIQFLLQALGKERGYVKRVENQQVGDQTIRFVWDDNDPTEETPQ